MVERPKGSSEGIKRFAKVTPHTKPEGKRGKPSKLLRGQAARVQTAASDVDILFGYLDRVTLAAKERMQAAESEVTSASVPRHRVAKGGPSAESLDSMQKDSKTGQVTASTVWTRGEPSEGFYSDMEALRGDLDRLTQGLERGLPKMPNKELRQALLQEAQDKMMACMRRVPNEDSAKIERWPAIREIQDAVKTHVTVRRIKEVAARFKQVDRQWSSERGSQNVDALRVAAHTYRNQLKRLHRDLLGKRAEIMLLGEEKKLLTKIRQQLAAVNEVIAKLPPEEPKKRSRVRFADEEPRTLEEAGRAELMKGKRTKAEVAKELEAMVKEVQGQIERSEFYVAGREESVKSRRPSTRKARIPKTKIQAQAEQTISRLGRRLKAAKSRTDKKTAEGND